MACIISISWDSLSSLCQEHTAHYSDTIQDDYFRSNWFPQSRNYPNNPKAGNVLKLSEEYTRKSIIEYFPLLRWYDLAVTIDMDLLKYAVLSILWWVVLPDWVQCNKF